MIAPLAKGYWFPQRKGTTNPHTKEFAFPVGGASTLKKPPKDSIFQTAVEQLHEGGVLPHVGDGQLFEGHEVFGVEFLGHDSERGKKRYSGSWSPGWAVQLAPGPPVALV